MEPDLRQSSFLDEPCELSVREVRIQGAAIVSTEHQVFVSPTRGEQSFLNLTCPVRLEGADRLGINGHSSGFHCLRGADLSNTAYSRDILIYAHGLDLKVLPSPRGTLPTTSPGGDEQREQRGQSILHCCDGESFGFLNSPHSIGLTGSRKLQIGD